MRCGWVVGKLGHRAAEGAEAAGQNWLFPYSHCKGLQKGLWLARRRELGLLGAFSVPIQPQPQEGLSTDIP